MVKEGVDRALGVGVVGYRRRVADLPPCPSCRGGLPVELVGPHRYFCDCCARDFSAVKDAKGDWHVDKEPMRYKARRHSLAS